MIEFLKNGGWFMVPIGVCLLFTIAIAIERLVNLRLPRYLNEGMLNRIREYLARGAFDDALGICRSKNMMFNRLMETAIVYRNLDAVDLRQLLEDQSKQEADVLERFLSVLRTIGTIAPLLGLLGTVAGMIKVFQTLSAVGLAQAANLSGGISEALITTAAGMCVAIPAIVLHNYFERRVSVILLKMEKRVIELILLLRSHHAVQTN
ncbi:MAG: MotA/TolQ/ExbB proton channel family protein [Acidobacteriota bacterium]|nr:MotA/TolQ/ExbB proton channel family protein [Acidobacteriota bacterium]